jgi:glycosyltransferase involved in cell wall biosynthesis
LDGATATTIEQDRQVTRPLRIALLGYRSNPFSGGQGVYIKYVSRALKNRGHDVHVISGEPYPELDNGIQLIKLPGLNLFEKEQPVRALRWRHLTSYTDLFEWASMISGGFPEPYTFGLRVSEYMRQYGNRYDIIHDNQCLSYGTHKIQRMGLPLVTTIHHPITFDLDIALANTNEVGMRLLIRRWHHFLRMQTKVARRLNYITTVSESSKTDICASFKVDPDKVHVIYNGVDCNEFRPISDIERAPYHLITTASADQPLKGTQHLIPAFASLRREFPELRLTFIGKPKPDGDAARLISQYELADHIDFKHGISPAEIVQLYASATIAVVPSEYEGFGLPAAEAMACAVPVVSTDGGALPEVVGDAGVIVAKADPTALTNGIRSLLLDPARRHTLGAAGRQRMLARFQWTDVATALTDYYYNVISA